MPKHDDHPLVRRRIAAGLSTVELSERANVHRSTIATIEDGRVGRPSLATLGHLAHALGTNTDVLAAEIERWRKESMPVLTLRMRAVIELHPELVKRYDSFEAWRRDLGFENLTKMASYLNVSRRVLSEYEKGVRERPGLPQRLQFALKQRFDLSDPYLVELGKLAPRGDS